MKSGVEGSVECVGMRVRRWGAVRMGEGCAGEGADAGMSRMGMGG